MNQYDPAIFTIRINRSATGSPFIRSIIKHLALFLTNRHSHNGAFRATYRPRFEIGLFCLSWIYPFELEMLIPWSVITVFLLTFY